MLAKLKCIKRSRSARGPSPVATHHNRVMSTRRTRESLPATFYRGGTSKAVFFREQDLPTDGAERARVFLAAIGSPDPYGRQLNGMGGGLSSVSKVISVEKSARDDCDVEYTFVQVGVKVDSE